jgi:hypothetical protein
LDTTTEHRAVTRGWLGLPSGAIPLESAKTKISQIMLKITTVNVTNILFKKSLTSFLLIQAIIENNI